MLSFQEYGGKEKERSTFSETDISVYIDTWNTYIPIINKKECTTNYSLCPSNTLEHIKKITETEVNKLVYGLIH